MKQLDMMIGLPRSGKSTWADEHKEGKVIMSADRFRMLIYGQRYFAGGEELMWATYNVALKVLLDQGIDIIIDNTNVTKAGRKKLIDLAKSYGYEVNARWVHTDYHTCIINAYDVWQDDLIPIIEKMAVQFEAPTLDEGFTMIHEI